MLLLLFTIELLVRFMGFTFIYAHPTFIIIRLGNPAFRFKLESFFRFTEPSQTVCLEALPLRRRVLFTRDFTTVKPGVIYHWLELASLVITAFIVLAFAGAS